MTTHQRPLSPHLQVYRWQITMLMSIAHRASGVLLTIGALGLVGWLLALASGPVAYEQWRAMASSLAGQMVLFALCAALVYHLLNGLRHLLWDSGRALDIPSVYRTGYTVWALTLVFTAGIWYAALSGGAA
ncbi:MAG: succinate dehydrogenase, cytochrome b556 subunit [Xanthomonadaceae bacterium]|nr:succinate dehydrogenase, cytochrome b556 subunit [Xanthomonadaceae bacterium]MDP2185728.1 succinate dehydrogenase, cytochrome b556 subunit [Xanthomonadales bacterium]MDZ4115011.1 succinate dehydrogenase, cytochrome b556 subunit [Xanthomonadaceae bacterium]MDZ4378079.1 succinate dehydrogenase, cytochrome b556 subunit [Xanthomonadaceae bacterium]